MNHEKMMDQTDLFHDWNDLADAAQAALFAVGGPMSFDKLALVLGVEEKEIPAVLDTLAVRYCEGAIELVIMEGFAQLVTKKQYAEVVRDALQTKRNQPLSKAALEVLAVVAYHEPVTRAFLDKVRGVESPTVLANLIEKGLIEEKGRLDAPGRPTLYGTTPVFLRTFGLSSCAELAQLPELAAFHEELRLQQQEESRAEGQPEVS